MSLPDHFEIMEATPTRVFARDTRSGGDVVIKELTLGRIVEWKELDLFEREVQTLRQLDHPSIPAFLEEIRSTEGEPRFHLVCERVDGTPLADIDEPLGEPRLLALARGVLDVLVYLQSFTPPIIHRNLTPEAILLTEADEVRVIDFGSVQVELKATMGGSTVVGTTGYMAPEQLLGRATPGSDLYALGACLVFALTGLEPSDLPEERMKLRWREHARFGEPRFLDWVDRLIEPDPSVRFATATDALRGLGGAAIGAMIMAGRPVGTRAKLTRSARQLELAVTRPMVRLRRTPLLIGFVVLASKAIVDMSFGAASLAVAAVTIWIALAIKDYFATGDTQLLLDIDRGYRLRGPDGVFLAGPLEDVLSVETGFRGERDALWLTVDNEPRQLATGLTKAEQAWLRGELSAFLAEHT